MEIVKTPRGKFDFKLLLTTEEFYALWADLGGASSLQYTMKIKDLLGQDLDRFMASDKPKTEEAKNK